MVEINIFGKIILLILLGISSVTDIKRKQISLFVVSGGFVAGVLFCLFKNPEGERMLSIFTALFPGIFLMSVSVLSEGKVGMGDGLIVCVGGLFLGFEKAMEWLFIASVICALYGFGIVLIQRKNTKTELAFVPFLFLATVGIFFKEMIKG